MDASFQERVGHHVALVTRGDPTDLDERRDRFGEESLELQQSLGQTRAEAHALVDYVFARPVGKPRAEMGGMLYTATALANEAGLDMADCAETELNRVSTPEMVEKIRRKRAGRHGRGPLPGADSAAEGAGNARAWFAEGVAARSAGAARAEVPYGAGVAQAAWEAGWMACEGFAGP